MITKEFAKQVFDKISKKTTADDFSLIVYNNDKTNTRFAQNGITQHISGQNNLIRLSVSYENKTGSASVNNLSDTSIDYLIKTAENVAKQSQPDPEFISTSKKCELLKIKNYAESTLNLTNEKMVDDISICVNEAKKMDAKLSGMSTKIESDFFYLTKNGFFGDERETEFEHSMTLSKSGIETKVEKSVKDYNDFSMKNEMAQLVSQFNSLGAPQKLAPQKIPVILRPNAVKDWFMYLFWLLDRRSADDGLTAFTDQIDKKIFGEKFNCRSVIDDPQIVASRWMLDGIPIKNIDWVKNGVLKNMFASRYYAKSKSIEPQRAYNMVIDGENFSENELMSKVDRGVIINSLWYIRDVDQKKGEFTGLTRDGVMYFENGKIQHSVFNFRWNEILHEATQRIIAMGANQPINTWLKVPSMLIDNFNFVDVTTF